MTGITNTHRRSLPAVIKVPINAPAYGSRKCREFKTCGLNSEQAARHNAAAYLKLVDPSLAVRAVPGFHYFTTLDDAGKWGWVPAKHATAEQQAAWRARRKIGVRFTAQFHGPAPVTHADAAPVVEVVPDTNAGEPTREQRRIVMRVLDSDYDVENQRYRGDHSDATTAKYCCVPVAWVATIRRDLYGDHDRNETPDTADLDHAIAVADDAAIRLLSMAEEAEALACKLKAARALLQ